MANKIEVKSKKTGDIHYDYEGVPLVDSEVVELVKVETVMGERPKWTPNNIIEDCIRVFDEHYILLVNWKELWA